MSQKHADQSCGNPLDKSEQTLQQSQKRVPDTGKLQHNPARIKRIRIIVLILIASVIAGLYLMKNAENARADNEPDNTATGYYASAVFDLDATDHFDLAEVLSHNLPVMIDFGADSCLPCIEMAPILVELNQELRGKAVIKFIDVWKNNSAAQDLPLQTIPTQFFFYADGSPYVPADPENAARNGFILYELRATGEHVYTAHLGGMSKDEILGVLKEMGME